MELTGRERLSGLADRLLSVPPAGRMAGVLGAARGRGIALLWHRIRPEGPRPHEAVRSVSCEDFARQLDILLQLGDIVPLRDLERPRRAGRPRFALTFDDDDAGHVEHTLPLLRDRGLVASFFLSGRWRDGLGPYWWEHLEARVRDEGLGRVATSLGVPPETDVARLAAVLTATPQTTDVCSDGSTPGPSPMSLPEARTLVAAGMEIGFHTVHHPSLPTLRAGALRAAVFDGRDELAAELGTSVMRFAYPHGHVDERVAAAVRAAGYRSAWTTSKRVIDGGADLMRMGRWDLGHLGIDAFRAAILRGLVRPAS
jgi:peptidoglycan/xylan/chitin deacetylase (PgdA/CDA1 family)